MNVIALSNNLYDEVFKDLGNSFLFIRSKEELTYERMKEINPKYIFFPHWSYIIDSSIYDNFNCVIFHMTDLPFGRGGSPLQNLISKGIYKTKISAIKCSEILDGGDIFLKKDFSLEEKSAHELYVDAGKIIKDMINEIVLINPVAEPQDGPVVIFPRRKPEQSNIQNIKELNKIFDYIRMLDAPGYPCAFLQNERIKYSFSEVTKTDGKLYAKVCIEEI